MDRNIVVRGAREHNLQNVDLSLPHGQLICFTGVSGSGKSSLAFDTIYAEGQRRYLESLSSYARQFIGQLPKPDVDHLSGLSPSISISQKSTSHNPRSTVGTITEIQDFMRVLFARVGTSFCHNCDRPVEAQTLDQICAKVRRTFAGQQVLVLAPLIRLQKGEHRDLFEQLLRQGFSRARVDGEIVDLSNPPRLEKLKKHSIELVVDRLSIEQARIETSASRTQNTKTKKAISKSTVPDVPSDMVDSLGTAPEFRQMHDALSTAIRLGEGSVIVTVLIDTESTTTAKTDVSTAKDQKRRSKKTASTADHEDATESTYSTQFACSHCSLSFEVPSPQLLSFNSPQGMCRQCHGLGVTYSYKSEEIVADDSLSIRGGAITLLGVWTNLSKVNQRRLRSIGEAAEKFFSLGKGYLLRTPWKKLAPELRNFWLHGSDKPLTVKSTSSRATRGNLANFSGLLPEFKKVWETTNNPMLRRQHEKLMQESTCPACQGQRLNPQARHLRLQTASKLESLQSKPWRSIADLGDMPLAEAREFFEAIQLDEIGWQIASEAVKEIRSRLGFLLEVGLEYLALNRTAPTLSGGESQRIRLASQIGSGLNGVTYVLDEPSIGLHPRDNDRLIKSLKRLRDIGNTLLVVEHDEDTMLASDIVVDFGPGPGVRGGKLLEIGSCDSLSANKESLTGDYLSGRRTIGRPETRRNGNGKFIKIFGARHHNLQNVDVEIPLGKLVCVTGVSGSGKSSLISDILSPTLENMLMKAQKKPGDHDSISGAEQLDKIIDIDQSPIGRTPRSNPATYVKVFDEIRNLYTQLTESKRRGYAAGRFSFNTAGGRCSACEGNGATRLDMEMLADLWVPCPVCDGRRYDLETLEVQWKGKSVADVLEMDVQEALLHFENVPKIAEKLQTLHDVGLDYIKLGQPSPTLSGGEAQRIKLAKELSRRSTGKTFYVLDEPTTGLHFHDISMLLSVLQKLVELGNTIVVVEHNLDLIQAADWVIDLGLEGGHKGGQIIACGTPEEVAENPESYTGVALKRYFESQLEKSKPKRNKRIKAAKLPKATDSASIQKQIVVEGAQSHNLKSVDVTIERDAMTVFCGHSGSGKTSLAMDTIYAEGQRRYVESLSSYARQFVGQMPKPIVDRISGLSPAVALEQKNLGHTPRSTVGTVTEIYDYLRVFMARVAQMRCPACLMPVRSQTVDQIVEQVLQYPDGTRALILAPMYESTAFPDSPLDDTFFDKLLADGFSRVRINGMTQTLADRKPLDYRKRHEIQVVTDRVEISKKSRSRIADSIEQALKLSQGRVQIAVQSDSRKEPDWDLQTHSLSLACVKCGTSYLQLTPHNYSFNTSVGWCSSCSGLGTQYGTNLDLLIDPTRSLRESGSFLWPDVRISKSQAMLSVLCAELQIDPNCPIGSLTSTKKNLLVFGTHDRWFDVPSTDQNPIGFSFQYRGIFPALELASRSSVALRMRLNDYVGEVACIDCGGSRVRSEAAHAVFRELTVVDLVNMPLGKLLATIQSWKLQEHEQKMAGELIAEMEKRLSFLCEVGLEYLTLGRVANTLSGGEAQRIRLASQLGSGLCGVLYVLDEPTIGLHPRDNSRLISALHRLRDHGNTLLVVEHDRDVIASSDYLCDFGPGSGSLGGSIVAMGPVQEVKQKSIGVTGPYLSGQNAISIPSNRRPVLKNSEVKWLTVRDAHLNTLRHIDAAFPLGRMTVVTGPSGSGKSSLINGILYPALAKRIHRTNAQPGPHRTIDGLREIDKVIRVDQSPLGNSPSSTPATYTGVFDAIRECFASLPEARTLRKTSRDFSFNVFGGRCEKCEGNGQCKIEMHFLPDVWVECDACGGKRYDSEILTIRYKDKSIFDVLTMSIAEAAVLFDERPKISRVLSILEDVGLGYMSLGQSAPTLSGGEAQRVKLASELARPSTGRTLYLLDEPTTGLHFDDIAKLLKVFDRLVDAGNTLIVVEHNLDVIKCADWIIDLGPEAGWDGGQIVFAGTPEQLAEFATESIATKNSKQRKSKKSVPKQQVEADKLISYTGIALLPVLAAGPYHNRDVNSLPVNKQNNLKASDDFIDLNDSDDARESHDSVANPMFDSHFFDAFLNAMEMLGESDSVDLIGNEIIEAVAQTVSELDLLELEIEPTGSVRFVSSVSPGDWFLRLEPSSDAVKLSFRLPVDSIHQLGLPNIRIGRRRSGKNAQLAAEEVTSFAVTSGKNWVLANFNIQETSIMDRDELVTWITEAVYKFHDFVNEPRLVND